jgi:hypothetical protein
MKANEKAMIDGLAKKAFESIIDAIPEGDAPVGATYRLPANGRITLNVRAAMRKRNPARRMADPFAFVACALALIMVIPPAIGKTRTTFADIATVACESGRLDGSAEFMTMVFARGGERFRSRPETDK